MSIVLLDTNVVSYLFKGDTRATAYAPLVTHNPSDFQYIVDIDVRSIIKP